MILETVADKLIPTKIILADDTKGIVLNALHLQLVQVYKVVAS